MTWPMYKPWCVQRMRCCKSIALWMLTCKKNMQMRAFMAELESYQKCMIVVETSAKQVFDLQHAENFELNGMRRYRRTVLHLLDSFVRKAIKFLTRTDFENYLCISKTNCSDGPKCVQKSCSSGAQEWNKDGCQYRQPTVVYTLKTVF